MAMAMAMAMAMEMTMAMEMEMEMEMETEKEKANEEQLAYWRDHVDEDEATDPSIYIRVWRKHDEAFEWYNLDNFTSENEKPNFSNRLNPCFPRRPTEHRYSSCVSMGSKIFVVGGGGVLASFRKCNKGPYNAKEKGNERYNDVWFMDTCNLNRGWTEGSPLQQGRAKPILACFDGKLYAVSSAFLWNKPLPLFVEVLLDNQSWSPVHYEYDIGRFPSFDYGYVDIDIVRCRILLHGSAIKRLYSYDVHKNLVEVVSDQFGDYRYASAIVDGIMYTIDYHHPGQLVGFDISNHGCSAIRVEFSDPIKCSHLPRPHPRSRTGKLPDHFLVALGNQRLAVVWSDFEVIGEGKPSRYVRLTISCSKWKMTKIQETDTIIKLVACQKSVKQYMVEGDGILESCLVVGQNCSSTSGEMDVETIETVDVTVREEV